MIDSREDKPKTLLYFGVNAAREQDDVATFHADLEEYTRQMEQARPNARIVVFFGDSILAGRDEILRNELSWTERTARERYLELAGGHVQLALSHRDERERARRWVTATTRLLQALLSPSYTAIFSHQAFAGEWEAELIAKAAAKRVRKARKRERDARATARGRART